jgi:hypothetical protein
MSELSSVREFLDPSNQKLVMGFLGKKSRAISAHEFPTTLRSYSTPPAAAAGGTSQCSIAGNGISDEEAWLLASAALAASSASTSGLPGGPMITGE